MPETPRLESALKLSFFYNPQKSATSLRVVQQTPPMRVVRGFPLEDGASLAHLHNVSGGVLGGDLLTMDFDVQPQARAQITTPGATRIYQRRAGYPDSQQITCARVETGGVLEYLPDALIPFAESGYRQETEIDLEADSGLFWWEILAPGREASGERFAYHSLEMRFSLRALGKPIALEQYRLRPAEFPATSLARFGVYLYHTTFYICRVGLASARWLDLEEKLTTLAGEFSQGEENLWGVSALVSDGLVIRGLGKNHRQVLSQLTAFWGVAKQELYGQSVILPRKLY